MLRLAHDEVSRVAAVHVRLFQRAGLDLLVTRARRDALFLDQMRDEIARLALGLLPHPRQVAFEIGARVRQHHFQQRGFVIVQIAGVLVEVIERGGLDTVEAVPKRQVIEIRGEDVLGAEIASDQYGPWNFVSLAGPAVVAGLEHDVLHELLGDRAAAAAQPAMQHRLQQTGAIEAAPVASERAVLGLDQHFAEFRRNVRRLHEQRQQAFRLAARPVALDDRGGHHHAHLFRGRRGFGRVADPEVAPGADSDRAQQSQQHRPAHDGSQNVSSRPSLNSPDGCRA